MNAVILGLFAEQPNPDATLETTRSDPFAARVEQTAYLDGSTIYHGTATDAVETQTEEVVIAEDSGGSLSITKETVDGQENIICEFVADLEGGYVGVDSSKGDFVFRWAGLSTNGTVARAEIDVQAFAEERVVQDPDAADPWQVGWSRGGDSEESSEEQDRVGTRGANANAETETGGTAEKGAGSLYHADADLPGAPEDGLSQLGFEYLWDGRPVRGTITASGYIALYDGAPSVDAFGRWLREEVLPYASLPEEHQSEQSNLTDASAGSGARTGGSSSSAGSAGGSGGSSGSGSSGTEPGGSGADSGGSSGSGDSGSDPDPAPDQDAEDVANGESDADTGGDGDGRFSGIPDGRLPRTLEEPVECSDPDCARETAEPYVHNGEPYCIICYDHLEESGEVATDGGRVRLGGWSR